MATRTLALPALLALMLPACGGDDSDPAPTTASAETETAASSNDDDDDDDDDVQTDGDHDDDDDDDDDDAQTGDDDTTGDDDDDDDDDDTGSSDDGATTGGQPDGPQWSLTEIIYAGPSGESVLTYDNCTFCDTTLNMSTLLVRFQQGDGWTVWSVDIPVGSTTGAQPITDDYSGAYVAINEASPDLPPDYAGYYDPTSASGTLTLIQADITPGGVVAGTLEVELSQGGIGATLSADFYAEITQ